ncbi:MAG: hypothetical protein M0Z38_05220 [Deltaproteobacteria bacterium]|nr:hypothetical protein [Deltaproteobacteria bacterium]
MGTVPFPAPKPVFVDDAGQAISGLPESPEPLRLVLLDFTWCPPCAEVWRAIREASREIPEASVHVYRVLFDRERLLGRKETVETAPLRPTPPPDAGTFTVTTVVALTDPFRKEYGPELAPVLILTDRGGKVLRRWTGYSHSLSADIVSEVRRLSSVPRSPGT